MASPQKERGYVAVANELIEVFFRTNMTGAMFRVLFHHIRSTYGYNKKEFRPIGLKTFVDGTGLPLRTVQWALRELRIAKILVLRDGYYSLNKDYETWVLEPGKQQPIERAIHCAGAINLRKELRPGRKGLDDAILIDKDNNKDNVAIVQTEPKTTTKTYSPAFLLFWSEYPRRDCKFPAWAEWRKIFPSDGADPAERALGESLMGKLAQDKESPQWQKTEPGGSRPFVPHARTWLHQRRWEDVPA